MKKTVIFLIGFLVFYSCAQTDCSAAERFVDNGDGTITDTQYGLMWQKTDDGMAQTFNDARVYAANLSLGGYHDWRLPAIEELKSIIDYNRSMPALDPLFTGTSGSEYWSRTAYPDTSTYDSSYTDFSTDDTSYSDTSTDDTSSMETSTDDSSYSSSSAWYVNFNDGLVNGADTSNFKYVRYVRSTPSGETVPLRPAFIDNGNGTMTDQTTGLTWQKADDGVYRNWDNARAYAEGLSLAGYNDWRLPTIDELTRLVDYDRISPACDSVLECHTGIYWSNSQYLGPYAEIYAWNVNFLFGEVGYDVSPLESYVRCVRSGTPDTLALSLDVSKITGTPELNYAFSASVTGGTPPYTYTWDFGDGETTESELETQRHAYDHIGTYTAKVRVTDTDGATGLIEKKIGVTEGGATDEFPLTVLPRYVSQGLNTTTEMTITGGEPPYSVTASNSLVQLSLNDAIVTLQSGDTTGFTLLTVTDDAGKQATSEINVIDDRLRLSEKTFSLPLQSERRVAIYGGQPPYEVLETRITGSVNIELAETLMTITGTTEGETRVEVTDWQGATVALFIQVTPSAVTAEPSSIEAEAGQTYQITVTGGTGAYAYDVGDGILKPFGQGNYLYTAPFSPGKTTLTFTDGSGLTDVVSVTVKDLPMTLTVSPSTVMAYAGDLLRFQVIGGKKPYHFKTERGDLISRHDICQEGGGEEIFLANLNQKGKFILEVTDAEGQQVQADVTVLDTVILNPGILYAFPNEKAKFEVTGGKGAYRFAYESGLLSTIRQGRAIYTAPEKPGAYWFNVTDSLKNITSSIVLVGDIPKITPFYMYTPREGKFNFMVGGGIPPYIVTSEAGQFEPIDSETYVYISPSKTGTYLITAHDSMGSCAQLMVEVGSSEMGVSPSTLFLASGESDTLTINNGKPPFTVDAEIGNISWTGQGKFRYQAPQQNNLLGLFSIVVTDTNGQKASALVGINETQSHCAVVDEASFRLFIPCLYLEETPVQTQLTLQMIPEANDFSWIMEHTEPVRKENEFPAILDRDLMRLTIPCLELFNESYFAVFSVQENSAGQYVLRLNELQKW